jgi:hypothetical protein
METDPIHATHQVAIEDSAKQEDQNRNRRGQAAQTSGGNWLLSSVR